MAADECRHEGTQRLHPEPPGARGVERRAGEGLPDAPAAQAPRHFRVRERDRPAPRAIRDERDVVPHDRLEPPTRRIVADLHASLRRGHRIATPSRLAIRDARKMATFATVNSTGSGNAWPAMNSDIVNPIPASAPAPASCRHVYASGLAATLNRTATHDAATIPTGLPITSPSTIASTRRPWPSRMPAAHTRPALASANSGSTT